MDEIEEPFELEVEPSSSWRTVPGYVFGLLGWFLTFGTVVSFVNTVFFGETRVSDLPADVVRVVVGYVTAGVVWLVASISWFKGRWWLATVASVLGYLCLRWTWAPWGER
jgi:hypothetical protein